MGWYFDFAKWLNLSVPLSFMVFVPVLTLVHGLLTRTRHLTLLGSISLGLLGQFGVVALAPDLPFWPARPAVGFYVGVLILPLALSVVYWKRMLMGKRWKPDPVQPVEWTDGSLEHFHWPASPDEMAVPVEIEEEPAIQEQPGERPG